MLRMKRKKHQIQQILNQKKQNIKNATFDKSQIIPSESPGTGDSHPPKNIIEAKVEISNMLAYSARKNTANVVPEYSTWGPATISDSPSATSKGALLVSATPAMK